jgi:tetratricopeptide (TPR) repeat protein
MQPGERFVFVLKLCLPLLVLVMCNVSPVPHAVTGDLRVAGAAQAGEQSTIAHRSETIADAYRRVLDREPWRAMLWDQVGQAELAGGRVPEAVDALQRADQAGALSAEGRFQLGEAYLRRGDPQAAVDTWEALLRLDGPSTRVLERLFQVHRAQGDYPAAITVLRAWREHDPQDARVAYLLGINLCVFQPDEALPLLLEASAKDSSYTASVQVLRRGLAQAGAAEAEAYRWLMIGRALGSISQWDLAEEAFRRAVNASPEYGEAWALLGEALYHIDGSGAEELEKASRFAPDSLVVRTLLALYWRREGKPEVALTYLEALAREEPNDPKWLVDIGNTLVDAQNFTDARAAFLKAVEMAPDNTLYWQYLARFSADYEIDVRTLGLPSARQAILLAPNDAGALDVMGLTLLKLGDNASAERFLQRALEKDATYAPANLHLGWLYLQQQDAGRAYLYLKQAANLAGENPVGMNARRLLRQYYEEGG